MYGSDDNGFQAVSAWLLAYFVLPLETLALSGLVWEAALEADVACRPVVGGDDSHRDAAGRADRRAVVVVSVALVRLLHKSSLVGVPWLAFIGRWRVAAVAAE